MPAARASRRPGTRKARLPSLPPVPVPVPVGS